MNLILNIVCTVSRLHMKSLFCADVKLWLYDLNGNCTSVTLFLTFKPNSTCSEMIKAT